MFSRLKDIKSLEQENAILKKENTELKDSLQSYVQIANFLSQQVKILKDDIAALKNEKQLMNIESLLQAEDDSFVIVNQL